MNWDDYDVFCHVIEQGGFSAAARETGRPKSTVSAAITRLEEELGVRLLERTTRQVHATDAGDALYHGIGSLFAGLRDARADALAQGKTIAGTLRIAAPYEFGAHHLGPVACELMDRYPRLKVRIDVEHEAVNPLEKRYDIAFAMLESGLPGSSLVQRRMFSLERGVYAAPALLERQGVPTTPQALAGMPLLCGAADTRWTFTRADGTSESIAVPAPRLHSGNATSAGRRRSPGSASHASPPRSARRPCRRVACAVSCPTSPVHRCACTPCCRPSASCRPRCACSSMRSAGRRVLPPEPERIG